MGKKVLGEDKMKLLRMEVLNMERKNLRGAKNGDTEMVRKLSRVISECVNQRF